MLRTADRLLIAIALTCVVGCTSAPSASVPPSASASPVFTSGPPVPEPQATVGSSPPPASPKPSPTPRPTAWSKPKPVGLDGCHRVTATIDEAGRIHLAASCQKGAIGYATSPSGSSWTATTFAPPENRLDSDAQVAFSGSTLYFAWTRQVQKEGGCGDDGIADVGVNIKTRTLPDGDWSSPRRIGEAKDHLQSLRIAGSTIHATVTNDGDGKTWYEAITGDHVRRTAISGATDTALRIGNDGVARIAYAHTDGIRYGAVDADGVRAATIPGSAHGSNPVFALASDGSASVFWTRHEYGGRGCAEPDPPATDGMYFATNASGTWKTEKVSDVIGGVSLTLDSGASEIHAVLEQQRGIDYLERPLSGGTWARTALPVTQSDAWVTSPVIRQDPLTGRLFVFFAREAVNDEEKEELSVEVVQR